MIYFFYIDNDGNINGQCTTTDEENIKAPSGLTVVLGKVPDGANAYIDGKFVTKPPTYDELALPILQQRELQLSSSDWTQNNDSPLSSEKKQEWSIFRQQWRDITSQPNYPYKVNYPVQPI
jgi:hypothetical protein